MRGMPTGKGPILGSSQIRRILHICCRKRKGQPKPPFLWKILVSFYRLQNLDVLCLPALRTLHHVELHLLAFLQAAESVGLDGRKMHEDIFAVLTADEAVSLCVVKPLYCSLFHVGACKPRCFFRLCAGLVRDWCRQGHSVEQGRRETATSH